ncbi:MAG: hypothetical protein CL946_12985 [Ectothiorhodospiraceae bacterium]|nr:hypothetical protein [Ectothiorhodospiraceae bacterium]
MSVCIVRIPLEQAGSVLSQDLDGVIFSQLCAKMKRHNVAIGAVLVKDKSYISKLKLARAPLQEYTG